MEDSFPALLRSQTIVVFSNTLFFLLSLKIFGLSPHHDTD